MLFNLLELLSSNFLWLALHLGGGSFPPPLSAGQERECLAAVANGDESARSILVEHNLRLVAHVIKKYYSSCEEQEELISIGTIGLIKAVNTFNSEKGTRLATYAARCIENEILMHFRSLKKSAQDISLSEPIDTDGEGNPLTLLDVVSTEDTVIDDLDLKLKSECLPRIIDEVCDAREKKIIVMRYGLDGENEHTQRETAAALGISRSYVSRIEKKVLLRLRKRFDSRD